MRKPTVVSHETVIFQGNEVDREVMCCEFAWRDISTMERKIAAIEALIEQFRPVAPGTHVIGPLPSVHLNYCPMCGTKYATGVQQ